MIPKQCLLESEVFFTFLKEKLVMQLLRFIGFDWRNLDLMRGERRGLMLVEMRDERERGGDGGV